MADVRIFPTAKERLLEIWEYTEKTWGEEQADRYIRGLVEAIEQARHARHRWRPVPDKSLDGISYLRYRHHYIFFREFPRKTLGVISVLHENMDLPAQLKRDSEQGEDE